MADQNQKPRVVSFALFFWGGIFVLLIEGFVINTLRNLMDSADAARLLEQSDLHTFLFSPYDIGVR